MLIFVTQDQKFMIQERCYETDIPTPQSKESENSRIFSSHANTRWKDGDKSQARTGKKKIGSDRLQEESEISVIGADKRLTRWERIRHVRDFARIRAHGQRHKAGSFVVIVAQNELGYRRIGFSISKKVGNSVVRNRLRRVIKEYFRMNKDKFPPSSDFLFICREPVGKLGLVEFAKIIEPLFDRLS